MRLSLIVFAAIIAASCNHPSYAGETAGRRVHLPHDASVGLTVSDHWVDESDSVYRVSRNGGAQAPYLWLWYMPVPGVSTSTYVTLTLEKLDDADAPKSLRAYVTEFKPPSVIVLGPRFIEVGGHEALEIGAQEELVSRSPSSRKSYTTVFSYMLLVENDNAYYLCKLNAPRADEQYVRLFEEVCRTIRFGPG